MPQVPNYDIPSAREVVHFESLHRRIEETPHPVEEVVHSELFRRRREEETPHPVEPSIIWMMGFVFIAVVIIMSVVGVQFLMPHIEYLRQVPAPVSYPIVVNYDLSLQEMIEAGQYGRIYQPDVINQIAPSGKQGISEVEIILVHFDQWIYTEEVLRRLEERNLRPATFEEILVFGATHPNMLNRGCVSKGYKIVALGSPVWIRSQIWGASTFRVTPCGLRMSDRLDSYIGSYRNKRILAMLSSFSGWCPESQFAAVCNISGIDTNRVGLTNADEVVIHKTDSLNKDYDRNETSDSEKPLGFGASAIPPSKHVLTFEEFLAGNFGGEYITTKAIIGKIKFDDNERQYSLHLSDPFDKSGLTIRGTEHIQVNTGWRFYPKLVDGTVMRVCSRFNLNLRAGDTIVIVGRSIWKQGSRMIDVSGRGAIFLILSKDEAITRWIPSMTNVRLLHE